MVTRACPEILPSKQHQVNRLLWFTIGAAIAAEFTIAHYIGLKISIPYIYAPLAILAFNTVVSFIYRYIRHDDTLSLLPNAFNQLVCGAFAISFGTFIGAFLSMPLTDKTLVAIDHFFGFDWPAYIRWVDSIPSSGNFLTQVYHSSGMQFLILLPMLFYNQSAHGQRVYMALYFAGLVTVVLFTLFPAVGAYRYYNFDFTQLHGLQYTDALIPEDFFLALHDHTMTTVVFPGEGCVAFPSYHTVVAVVLIYASLPYRPLFVLSVPLNILMLLSTPFNGGHYLVDVLVGGINALLCIYIAERILPRRPKTVYAKPKTGYVKI